jgi:hypothetical protein
MTSKGTAFDLSHILPLMAVFTLQKMKKLAVVRTDE